MDWRLPALVAIAAVVIVMFLWEWLTFERKTRARIARSRQMASVVLYRRAVVLLWQRFARSRNGDGWPQL